MDHFPISNGFSRFFQLVKNRLESVQAIVRNPRNNEAKPEPPEVIFYLDSAVNCDKYVEVFLGKGEKGAVLAGTPAALSNGPYSVSWKGTLQPCGDALI